MEHILWAYGTNTTLGSFWLHTNKAMTEWLSCNERFYYFIWLHYRTVRFLNFEIEYRRSWRIKRWTIYRKSKYRILHIEKSLEVKNLLYRKLLERNSFISKHTWKLKIVRIESTNRSLHRIIASQSQECARTSGK